MGKRVFLILSVLGGQALVAASASAALVFATSYSGDKGFLVESADGSLVKDRAGFVAVGSFGDWDEASIRSAISTTSGMQGLVDSFTLFGRSSNSFGLDSAEGGVSDGFFEIAASEAIPEHGSPLDGKPVYVFGSDGDGGFFVWKPGGEFKADREPINFQDFYPDTQTGKYQGEFLLGEAAGTREHWYLGEAETVRLSTIGDGGTVDVSSFLPKPEPPPPTPPPVVVAPVTPPAHQEGLGPREPDSSTGGTAESAPPATSPDSEPGSEQSGSVAVREGDAGGAPGSALPDSPAETPPDAETAAPDPAEPEWPPLVEEPMPFPGMPTPGLPGSIYIIGQPGFISGWPILTITLPEGGEGNVVDIGEGTEPPPLWMYGYSLNLPDVIYEWEQGYLNHRFYLRGDDMNLYSITSTMAFGNGDGDGLGSLTILGGFGAAPIPEPAALTLLLCSAAGAAAIRERRRPRLCGRRASRLPGE